MDHQISCLWKESGAARGYSAAVSLHGHTNHSKESLSFILEMIEHRPFLNFFLKVENWRARRTGPCGLDLANAYWTPPLPAVSALELELSQLEQDLGLPGMVSLTDHDNIEAPLLLSIIQSARKVPISTEWTVPYMDAEFHIGVHNLPPDRAESIVADLNAFTANPDPGRLRELLTMLDAMRDVLVVLNHPYWDLREIGRPAQDRALRHLIAAEGARIHAMELSGIRSWQENLDVRRCAEASNILLIGGGDRHGLEPNAVVNLTHARTFAEFVHEVRRERCSHVLFMPQYQEPLVLRKIQCGLDAIRENPDHALGWRHWDERVFHPDSDGRIVQASALWKHPPLYLSVIFRLLRLLENPRVHRALSYALTRRSANTFDTAQEAEAAR